jgi:hypothetical protein
MLTQQKLIVSLVSLLFAASAKAGPLAYVVTLYQQFGTVDVGTGAFQQIGADTPDLLAGLVQGPHGSLLTVSFSGDLESINPANGVTSLVGATGLGDLVGELAQLGGTVYATDILNNLYTIDATTGASTLIGPTGIPAFPFSPGALFEEGFFGSGGKLYATFDSIAIDPGTLGVTTLIAPMLYQIDPLTGVTTAVGPTSLSILASVAVDGAFYALNATATAATAEHPFAATAQVLTLDLASGATHFVTDVDSAAGAIFGAIAVSTTPEPASLALAGAGIVGIVISRRRPRG